MTTDVAPDQPIDPALRRLIWVLVLGALAPALDTTIVNVALAALGRALHAPVATTQWVITGYLLAMGTAMPVTRWASERLGSKRMWLGCLGLSLASSALAGAAWDITSLIVFRLVQGAVAGLMIPLLTTLLVQAAGPKRLGRMMSIAMLPVVVVPVFGPVLGGLIVSSLSWRWIFLVNVPLCLAGLVLAGRALPPDPPGRRESRLDLAGLMLLSPGLGLIIYGLAQAAGRHGFARPAAWIPIAAGLTLTGVFAVHAGRRRDQPLINVRLLMVRSLAASVGVLFLAGLSVYGPLLLLALYYQQVQGRSVLMTGLLLAPQGIGSLLPRAVAGRLNDRIGPRLVAVTGLILTAGGTLAFAWAGPDTSGWLLAGALFVRGAGLAPVTIAVMGGAFRDVPAAEVPDASSTTRIVQQVGGAFGAAVLAVILASALRSQQTAAAFHTAFWWATGLAALALVPALLLPSDVTLRRAASPRAPAPRAPSVRAGPGS